MTYHNAIDHIIALTVVLVSVLVVDQSIFTLASLVGVSMSLGRVLTRRT